MKRWYIFSVASIVTTTLSTLRPKTIFFLVTSPSGGYPRRKHCKFIQNKLREICYISCYFLTVLISTSLSRNCCPLPLFCTIATHDVIKYLYFYLCCILIFIYLPIWLKIGMIKEQIHNNQADRRLVSASKPFIL